MRGSQWEGEGGGPGIGLERVLLVVGLIIGVSVVAVYYAEVESPGGGVAGVAIQTITTTGVACGTGSIPQTAVAVEADPRFVALAGGLCYSYMGEDSSGGVPVLTFDRYNGTIVYECGTTAHDLVVGQIEANVTSDGAIGSIWAPDLSLRPQHACPAPPPVSVVSVDDVSSLIPAVPELKITLQASPHAQAIATLRASLTLAGGAESFVFVAPPAALAPGGEVSKSQITSTFSSEFLYPLTVSGTFADGQAFTVQAYVQVAEVP
jgi:hypothetical protein